MPESRRPRRGYCNLSHADEFNGALPRFLAP
jgi:hypothetical protein